MPDSDAEPDSMSTFARLVRHHNLQLDVLPTSMLQRAQNPEVPPLRGRVISAHVGTQHEVQGDEPFVLFDKLAAYVLANYQLPAEPEPEPTVTVAPTTIGLWGGPDVQATARIRPVAHDFAIDLGASHELDHVLRQMTTRAAVIPQHPARNDREAF